MPNPLGSFQTQAIADASNSATSLMKISSTTKAQANAVQKAVPGDITVYRDVFLTTAYGSVIPPPTQSVAADFYRFGKDAADSPTQFEYPPRFLGDAADTPASIRLIGKNPLNNPGPATDLIPPYTKFFLESVQETHSERSQIVETFGDFYVFFFGERPPIYTFSGTLLSSDTINWAQDYVFYYDNFLRGTKCVELNASLVITYGYTQVEGFLLNTSMNVQSANEKGIGVSFQVLVIDRKILKLSLDFGLTLTNGQFNQNASFLDLLKNGLSAPFTSAQVATAQAALNKKTPTANGLVTQLADANVLKTAFPGVSFGASATGALKVFTL